ncbi:hypothetical protein DYH09_10190 [bacterium CPR1]|nr:hypothetical protein [bacterium CPR1]
MRKRRAMALVTTLLMMGILALMLIAFTVRLRAQGFFGLQSQSGLAALNAAEAGVADALSRLTANPNWSTDLINQPLPSGGARYSIRFSPAASVNNIGGGMALPGPRGPVQPGTAFLVVDGEQGLTHRVLEVVVTRQGPASTTASLTGSGVIRLRGNVEIDGIEGLSNPVPVDADVRSGSSVNSAGQVLWTGAPGESATIKGSVFSASAHPSAIQMGGASVTGQVQNNQPSPPPPIVDITGRISANSGAPAPALVPGVTTLAAGDYYVAGNLNYNGDLDLQGANLYVAGNLTVNGTIKGQGSVFSGGNTSFYGDSEITASNAEQVSLYSKGSVALRGFDGTTYLDNLVATAGNDANGVPYSTHWANTRNWTGQAQTLLASFGPTDYGFQGSDFDFCIDMLGHEATADVTPPFVVAPNEMAPVVKLNNLLQAQPVSPTQQFLLKKFTYLQDPTDQFKGLYAWHTDMGDMQNDVNAALANGSTDGLADGSNDSYSTYGPAQQALIYSLISSTMNQLDYDRLGAADPTNPGLQVNPGDIYLNRGVRVTFVRDLLEQSGSTIGTFQVSVWMSR